MCFSLTLTGWTGGGCRGRWSVRVGQLIAGLHTGQDDGTRGHGMNGCEGVRHPVFQLGYEFFELILRLFQKFSSRTLQSCQLTVVESLSRER